MAADGGLETVLAGLAFPECLRWRDGALWFSDIAAGRVHRWCEAEGGALQTVVEGLDRPAGLGWLPGGELLIVEGGARRLLRLDGSLLVEHADLAGHAEQPCNDMVVDALGRAWVGHWGFDYAAGESPRPASLLRVDPDGHVAVAADGLAFPNGCAITSDGRMLIVAETFAARLTAFDIGEDGALTGRREWAALKPASADGLCLDAGGAVWVASPTSGEVMQVQPGGSVGERLRCVEQPLAVALGGADRRMLYIGSSHLFDRVDGRLAFTPPGLLRAERRGRIERVRVAVPGTGLP